MACCKPCCGCQDCESGQEGKCCCGGAEGTCCQPGEYCVGGACVLPCGPNEQGDCKCGSVQCAADEYCCQGQCVEEGAAVPTSACCADTVPCCGDDAQTFNAGYLVPNPLSDAFYIDTEFDRTNANGVPLCPDTSTDYGCYAISYCGYCDQGCPEGTVGAGGGVRVFCGDDVIDVPCICCSVNSFP